MLRTYLLTKIHIFHSLLNFHEKQTTEEERDNNFMTQIGIGSVWPGHDHVWCYIHFSNCS